MDNEQYVWKNGKQLRTGYTTGSCAAGAAKAAAYMLFSDSCLEQVSLLTPKGVLLYLEIREIRREKNYVICAVKKDAGDDPDVTHGVYVYAKVEKTTGTDTVIEGGTGVGRITRAGLEQGIGQPAINRVPRQMILAAVEEMRIKYQYDQGVIVTISIPEGIRLAERTFNPRLGIEGGISVLGTTGIVEPMSEKALVDTIAVEMKMLKENGHYYCYVVPGNYGADFLKNGLGYEDQLAVKCSNFIGETIDIAVRFEMKGILFIGHAGKLLKLAAGVMNTHSRQADCRMEILAAHAAMAGADRGLVTEIMNAVTTTEVIGHLQQMGLLNEVMRTIMEKITLHLNHRAGSNLAVGAIIFTQEEGIIGSTPNAKSLRDAINLQKKAVDE